MSGVKKEQSVKLWGSFASQVKRLSPFGRFSPPALTLVVSLTAETLKVGHGRMVQGDFWIEGVAVEDVSKKTDAQIAQALILYCQVQKIVPTQVFCLLSSKQFIFKNVDIPSTEKEEVAKIIDLQAGRFTPYAREEIVIDFVCLESLVQHFTSVLLYIVNRKIADRFVSIFQHTPMQIDKVAIAANSMAVGYLAVAEGGSEDAALGGLHLGEEYSELTVIDGGQVVFVRNIPVGADALKKNSEQARRDFIQELNGSISAYHDQGVGKPLKRLCITGVAGGLTALGDSLGKIMTTGGEKLGISTFDYRRSFHVHESVLGTVSQADRFSFFELFSVLAHSDQLKVNLILPEVRLRQRVRETSRDILWLGILIMALLLLMSLILGSKIYFKRLVNQKLIQVSQRYGEEAKRLEVVSTKNRIIKKLIDSRGKELTVLNVINGFIEDDLYLSQVNYDSEGHVAISGTAASMSRVFAFVTQLMQSNYFSKVETKETKSRKEGKQDVADFVIECVLAKGL